MRACLLFHAAVIGVGLALRGFANRGAAFLAVAAAAAIWRARLTPLRKIETALVAALLMSCLAGRIDGAIAALFGVAALEVMRIM